MVISEHKFKNIFTDGKKLYTKNLAPGYAVYGEKLIAQNAQEYRMWNPYRSKLAALMLKGCSHMPIAQGNKILYLGAASGTTCSHVSDIVESGIVYCLEYSPRAFRDLLLVCRRRGNMIPILGDANKPGSYAHLLSPTDVIYQDIAQPNQTEIFLKNLRFLKSSGHGIIMLKARSIDVALKPEKIYKREVGKLKSGNLKILETVNLRPYEKDHLAIIVAK